MPVSDPATVIVVDDDPRARAALAGALSECTRVRVIGLDPGQADRQARRAPRMADAVVVDMTRDPARALTLVLRLAPDVTVIATSISGTSRQRALAAGAVAFLEKDGDGDALVRGIPDRVRPSLGHNGAKPDTEIQGRGRPPRG